jgi:hypothetical protein
MPRAELACLQFAAKSAHHPKIGPTALAMAFFLMIWGNFACN